MEVVFTPRSERWQGELGEVFEVAGQCGRPVSAIRISCGIGGWEWVSVVRKEGGVDVDGLSETRRSRAHFRSKHIPPKHTLTFI